MDLGSSLDPSLLMCGAASLARYMVASPNFFTKMDKKDKAFATYGIPAF